MVPPSGSNSSKVLPVPFIHLFVFYGIFLTQFNYILFENNSFHQILKYIYTQSITLYINNLYNYINNPFFITHFVHLCPVALSLFLFLSWWDVSQSWCLPCITVTISFSVFFKYLVFAFICINIIQYLFRLFCFYFSQLQV